MPVLLYLADPESMARRLLGSSPPLVELLSESEAIGIARALLENAVEKGRLEFPPASELERVVGYHTALALASLSRSPVLVRAIIEATYEHAISILRSMRNDDLERTAKVLGARLEKSGTTINWIVDNGRIIPLHLQYSIDLPHYLAIAGSSDDPMLLLPNSFLRGRRVYLDRDRLISLLAFAVKKRVQGLIDKYRSLESSVLSQEARRLAARLSRPARGGIDWESVPECIRRLVDKGVETDEEAYMLVSFIAYIGPDRREIEEVLLRSDLASSGSLENLSDAILSLGRRFTPYKCDSELGKKICGSQCQEGVLREYFQRVKEKRRRRGS